MFVDRTYYVQQKPTTATDDDDDDDEQHCGLASNTVHIFIRVFVVVVM